MRDIHGVEKNLKAMIEKLKKDKQICKANKDSIFDYLEYCRARDLKTSTIRKDLYAIRFVARRLKNKTFKDAKEKDFVRIISIVNEQKWSYETKRNHRVVLKKFTKWAYGIKQRNKYPTSVDWIETTSKKEREMLPEELITKEEFDRMLSVCDNLRDKCILFLLFETGVRIGEALDIQLKHIVFQKDGSALVLVSGKTGMRRIPLFASVPAIKSWLNIHPLRDNPESYLIVTNQNRYDGRKKVGERIVKGKLKNVMQSVYVPINYNGMRKILQNIKKKAKLEKRIYLHLFRHTSGTDKASWMSDRLSMQFHGWKTSRMVARYSHLSVKDLSEVMKKHYGLSMKEEEEREVMEMVKELIQVLKPVIDKNPKAKKKFKAFADKKGFDKYFKG